MFGNVSEDTILISIFMALEGVHAYSAFLPSVFTIKTFVSDNGGVDMIREGEFMASVFLVTLAGVTTYLTKSAWPMLFGLVAGAGMLAVYEHALRRCPARERHMDEYGEVIVG